MKRVQIIYPIDATTGTYHRYFLAEAEAMRARGFIVDSEPRPEAGVIIQRGFCISRPEKYPADERMLQGWEENIRTLDFTRYGEYIKPWTIPFTIMESLGDEEALKATMRANSWEKVFIKSKNTSLIAFGDKASVYPTTPLEEMMANYAKIKENGPFIIREYIADPSIFLDEERYWVLNGHVYHPSASVPEFVEAAAKRVYEYSGSHYFVIDAARNFIVEVNPGESSDRGGENPLEFFADIFAREFLG